MHLNLLEKSDIQAKAARYLPQGETPRLLFTCEHASNKIPSAWGKLGVDKKDLDEHIGWDIGAVTVTETLSAMLKQPAIVSGFSRLFFDINRTPGSPDTMLYVSDGTVVPGNKDLSQAEQHVRKQLVYDPYFDMLDTLIKRHPTLETIISVHSCAPELAGVKRPWDIGILWQNNEASARVLIHALTENTSWCVGDNQPYNPTEHPVSLQQAVAPHKHISLIWLEIRNDLISSENKAIDFSTKIQQVLTSSYLNSAPTTHSTPPNNSSHEIV